MSVFGWLVIGLLAGFIASKIVYRRSEGLVLDIFLGVVGAMVGGIVCSAFGAAPVDGLNLYSFGVATAGAVLVLLVFHAFAGRRVT